MVQRRKQQKDNLEELNKASLAVRMVLLLDVMVMKKCKMLGS